MVVHPVTPGIEVEILDPNNFYYGHHGVVKDHFDARAIGGHLAYTVEMVSPTGWATISTAVRAEFVKLYDPLADQPLEYA